MTRSTLDTRLRYSATCFCGPPASSMMTSSIGVPPKPFWVWGAGTPPALRNSATSSAELRAGTPKGPAAGPDSSVTMPTLIGCCASTAGVASSITSAASAARNQKLDDSRMVSSSISVSLKHGPFRHLVGLARETARASTSPAPLRDLPAGAGGSAARGSRIPIISQCEASRVKCRIGEVRQGLACLGNLVLSKVDNIEPFALDRDSNFTVRDGIRQNLQSIAACLL